MNNFRNIILFVWVVLVLPKCEVEKAKDNVLKLDRAYVGNKVLNLDGLITDEIPVDKQIALLFSNSVNKNKIEEAIILRNKQEKKEVNFVFLDQDKTVMISPVGVLDKNTIYTITIAKSLEGKKGEIFQGMEMQFKTIANELKITSIFIHDTNVLNTKPIQNVPLDLSMTLTFSSPVDENSIVEAAKLSGPGTSGLTFSFSDNNQSVLVKSTVELTYSRAYTLSIDSSLRGMEGERFNGFSMVFYTVLDSTNKFPEISDEELLTKVQEQTFKYFWDFGHPVSGLARERNTSGDLVTTGGSGFGIMAIIVGIEREFISRGEGIERLSTMIHFLYNTADRFHGVWPHWFSGTTGKVIPFSSDDDGGDLVETSFMIQALYTLRQYLDKSVDKEESIINIINHIIDEVEWDWYTQGGQNMLFWHWSPNYGWQKNMPVRGWNEALITYILAAASTTHSINKKVYEHGWARDGDIRNTGGKKYYGYQLPLRNDKGGPLFFAHYSFLGLDPRNLQDQYADYWEQNLNHVKINRAYCISNPKGYAGYSSQSWGLTASDGDTGYSAHSPDNDKGVITPTAAISSIPYTPEASMEAMRFFYYILGDKIWGDYGFYDAYNITENWYADSYIAIDQGPIICMIENYRTGKLWDLFMSASEIQASLEKLGFNY